MTQNNNYTRRRSKYVKVMALILALAVGGSLIMTVIGLIIAGI